MDFFNKITSFFLQKKEKNIIIDPISCLIKLSMLGLYPIGTKISVNNNGIHFYQQEKQMLNKCSCLWIKYSL